MNPKVSTVLSKAKKWQTELAALRQIVLKTPLTEELKWYQACYTFAGSNIVIVSGFKEYCALNFCKGALLKDTHGLLVKPGANTQSGRQIRFTSLQQIQELEPVLQAHLLEAIAAEKAGLKVAYKKPADFPLPAELLQAFAAQPALKTAFYALTPGRQRAYNLYFSGAKQSQTRAARIEKCVPRILQGKGIHDEP